MIEINLLPRELRKKGKAFSFNLSGKKNVLYLMGGVVAVIVFVIGSTFYQTIKLKNLDSRMREAQARTEKLKKDIQLVDALTELKDKLLQRMNAIETLDRNRSAWIDILQDLSQRIPEYLWLSTFKEIPLAVATPPTGTPNPPGTPTAAAPPPPVNPSPTPSGRKVTIAGYTYSINSLANFMIQLMKSNYFKNIELNFVKSAEMEKQKLFSFELGCDLFYETGEPSFAEQPQTSGASNLVVH
ncbi:MAG TPA: PilN domain-containing protein [candidate division Zixibacteria bacterium]|nr:PilN domain-containing protein [candidate division Zixibacteria bacterium]